MKRSLTILGVACLVVACTVSCVHATSKKDSGLGRFISLADPVPQRRPEPSHEPKAVLLVPSSAMTGMHVILDFAGTVSETDPDFDVAIAPEGSTSKITKLYDPDKKLLYGMFIPDKAGQYRLALIASAASHDPPRVYAFSDIKVTETPLPDPKQDPPPPLPTPVWEKKDVYGLAAFSRGILQQMPTTDPWRDHTAMIADSFDKVAAEKDKYSGATPFVQATSADYKSKLGKSYSYWSYHYFEPLQKELARLNTAGILLPTVDAHVEAWREISQAFREFPSEKKGGRR